MKKLYTFTLMDAICDLRIRKVKSQFFDQMEKLLNWEDIEKTIDRYYKKGKSATGKPAHRGIVLFKMSLLQTWYGLSDYEIEDSVNDRLSFGKFCGLGVEDIAPDHSTLSRFRTALTKVNAYQSLLENINKQLESKNVILKTGVTIDASVVETPLKPKKKASYEISQDRKERSSEAVEAEKEAKKVEKVEQPSVDTEASWLKKGGKYYYGYKKHHVSDTQGMVRGVKTTSANVNEISNLEEVLDTTEIEEGEPVYGDKGYRSAKNEALLKQKKFKSRILVKAKKGSPLTHWQKVYNKGIGKKRYVVERTFGSIQRWFEGGFARYRGIEKMHTQNILEAISYNLYRSPGIVGFNP